MNQSRKENKIIASCDAKGCSGSREPESILWRKRSLANTYVDAKHSLHFKVTRTRVKNERKRRRGYITNCAHDAEREKTNDSCGKNCAGHQLRINVQGLPGTAPSVHAAKTKHAGIDS